MLDITIFTIFIPTVFVASITPSICMTLALSLGIKVGFRRTLWMIAGELVGVSCVFIICGFGASSLLLYYPSFFAFFKYLGGAYIIFLGFKSWFSKADIEFTTEGNNKNHRSNFNLVIQGFTASFFHPKAWAFLAVFLSSFIKKDFPLIPQVGILLSILLVIETNSLVLYAAGGKALQKILSKKNNIRLINFIVGTLLVGVGLWLIFI